MVKSAEHLDNFISVVEKLEKLGVDYRIDLALRQGFRILYRHNIPPVHRQTVIGGGGRYDALITQMGGRATTRSRICPVYGPVDENSWIPSHWRNRKPTELRLEITPDALETGFNLAEMLRDSVSPSNWPGRETKRRFRLAAGKFRAAVPRFSLYG
jgi:hypothetical protein